MSAERIDGTVVAERLRARVAEHVDALERTGQRPGLAVLLVGKDPASEIYVRNKRRLANEAGISTFEYFHSASVSEEQLLETLGLINDDPEVHGILCQLPLPDHLSEALAINTIRPEKDVDGFNIANVGRLATGQEAMIPCTPLGCLILLRERLGSLAGLRAVVLGRSNIVGKPMATLLLQNHCTVTIAHSRTRDLKSVCRQADILVTAVGRPEMVRGDWIKEGATVIDVGINRIPAPERGQGKTRLVGDVHFASASERAGAITPVPGGVGPMTIACLLANTVIACFRARGLEPPDDLWL
ncbi:MAG: bifunctional methylenetetrahydrofolate dehydrogenase/methenyltetrahydrofolate cyclohydrolase FolD [Paracoccaceae bacterium]|nr:bifunctional methylenetetrahydrofolate dehydrogenase/methenyltetrahydrofolate cyclohydrolase FolD [Paracoccaceae bacterium]